MPEEVSGVASLDLVSLGECMVEFSGQGTLGESPHFSKSFGGDALNCLVAATRLGSKTGFITRVGSDPFKDYLLGNWEEEEIDLSQVRVVEGFNGIYFISLGKAGQREFFYYRQGSAASKLSPEDLPEDIISRCRIFFSSGISQAISSSCREAVLAGYKMARRHGRMVAYDPNFRARLWPADEARKGLEEVVELINIALPSFPEESEALLGLRTPEEVIDYFWAKGVEIVAVKKGQKGATIGQGGKIVELPLYETEVVDTTGAGDAFNGAFLHGLAGGLDPFSSGILANIVAGLSVTGRGAIAALPRREEVYPIFQKLLRAEVNETL